MAKLVDAGDSKSPAARCVGSSPTLGTMENKPRFAVIFLPVVWAHFIASLRIIPFFRLQAAKNQLLLFFLTLYANTFSICISWHTCHHTCNKPIQSTINHILLQILFLIASQTPCPIVTPTFFTQIKSLFLFTTPQYHPSFLIFLQKFVDTKYLCFIMSFSSKPNPLPRWRNW